MFRYALFMPILIINYPSLSWLCNGLRSECALFSGSTSAAPHGCKCDGQFQSSFQRIICRRLTHISHVQRLHLQTVCVSRVKHDGTYHEKTTHGGEVGGRRRRRRRLENGDWILDIWCHSQRIMISWPISSRSRPAVLVVLQSKENGRREIVAYHRTAPCLFHAMVPFVFLLYEYDTPLLWYHSTTQAFSSRSSDIMTDW